ncbi:MAG: hypothetical protein K5873_02285 [Treponema sp.]|nr:hypothetical protein [Treponema sp.]
MKELKGFSVRFFQLSLIILLALSALSCKGKNDGVLQMEELAPEDLSPRIEWALVCDPYVACRREASYESVTIESFRKGEIYEIKGNCTILVDESKELWYAVEDGWIPSSAVKVYSNKLKAENAKKSLK